MARTKPRLRRWTRIEYERLVDLGVFRCRGAARVSDAGRGWHYGSVTRLRGHATVTPLAAPGVTIRVADLLP